MIPARRAVAIAIELTLPAVLVMAVHLFLVGHDEPGGGFAGGLLVAGALSLDAIADPDADRPWLVAEPLLGCGLLLAGLAAVAPLAWGDPLLASGFVEPALLGIKAKLSTVLFFDLGVLLVVVGLAASILERVREVLR